MGAKSLKSGDKLEIKMIPQDWNGRSTVKGKVYNSKGQHVYDISGSWFDEMFITNKKTGEKKTLWKENLQKV